MNQIVRKPSVLVYETQKFQSLAEVFSGLGSSCDYVHVQQDFLSKLASASYSGVCIVATCNDIANLKNIFLELESKSLLEGLRSVLMLVRSPGHDQFFVNSKVPWLVQFQFSFLRDIIEIDAVPPPVERDFATRRIAFATQFDSRNPFGQKFSMLSRWKANAEVSVPARLSWFNETQNILGIECGARIAKETSVRVILQVNGQAVTMVGVVKDNMPGQLRFNFGNSLAIELLESSSSIIKKLIRNEISDQVIRRNLRRAFLVTRSVALRQKLVRSFTKNDVDCRIPLVKRNILADLPLLSPHFIIIEDRVLEELVDRDGEQVYTSIRNSAGARARIAIVSDGKSGPVMTRPGFDVISPSTGIEAALETWVKEQNSSTENEVSDKRTWFTHGCRIGRATAVVEEKTHQLSTDGVVIRGHNHYRMWANVEVAIPGTGIQFVGKTVAGALACDSFRSQTAASIHENPNLVFISLLTRSNELSDEVVRHLRAQLSNLVFASSLPDGGVRNLELPRETRLAHSDFQGPLIPIAPEQSFLDKLFETTEEFYKKIKKIILLINFKKLGIIVAALIIAALMLRFLSEYRGNEGKIYSDSFRALFESRSK